MSAQQITKYPRTTIVHEGYDIAYVSLWSLLTSSNIDEEARRRGYSEQDIVRIHKQVEKIKLRLRDRAHDFVRRPQVEEEEIHNDEF